MPPSPDRGPVTAPDHRLDRLPRRRRRLVALLLLAALVAVVYLLTVWAQTLVGDDPVDWVQPVPAMLASFAGGYVGMRVQRRRLGGADRLREYDRALRAGRLPDDADPAVWERCWSGSCASSSGRYASRTGSSSSSPPCGR